MFSKNSMKKLFDKLRPLRRIDFATLKQVIKKNDVVLDYGCGRMPYKDCVIGLGATYRSADISVSSEIDYIIDDKGQLVNCNEVFDVIIIMDVLQHILEPDTSLLNLNRHMSNDTKIIVTSPFIFVECDYHDYHRWTNSGIEVFLKRLGYNVIQQIKRGGTVFSLVYLIQGTLSNLIIGRRGQWRLNLSIPRYIALVSLEILFMPILWFALFLDTLIPIDGGYLGSVTISRKDHSDHAI